MKKKSKLLLLALAAVLITGCSAADKASDLNTNSSRVYVSREQAISSVLVHSSETEGVNYSQDELKADVESAVSLYNEAKGVSGTANSEGAAALPVSLKSCTLEDRTGTLVFEYASGEDLVEFARQTGDDSNTLTAFTAEGVAAAIAAGRLEGLALTQPDGTAATSEEIAGQEGLSVVLLEGAATVQTEGAIAYVSEGVKLTSEFTAQADEGTHCIIFK